MADWETDDDFDDGAPPSYDVGSHDLFPRSPPLNDKIPLVIFAVFTLIIFILGIVGAATRVAPQATALPGATTVPASNVYSGVTAGPVVVTLFLLSLVAALLCAAFLFVMRRSATMLIYGALGLGVLLNVVAAIVFFAKGVVVAGIIALAVGAFSCLWFFLVRARIPFTALLIETVASITVQYPATLVAAFAAVPVQLVWFVIWAAIAISVQTSSIAGAFTWVLLLLSLFWTSQIIKNVVHCTVSGLVGSWYFQSDAQRPASPTAASFRRAITTSLGSIAFGSLVTSLIRVARALCNSHRLLRCLLRLVERLVRYFSSYAFVYVSLYGRAFVDSSRSTFDLFKSRGVDVIINDYLLGSVITLVGLLVGVLCALLGFALPFAIHGAFNPNHAVFLSFAFATFGFFVGFNIASITMNVLESATQTLMVGIAEDPHTLGELRPQLYAELQQRYPGVLSAV